jgi:hypothetical protein
MSVFFTLGLLLLFMDPPKDSTIAVSSGNGIMIVGESANDASCITLAVPLYESLLKIIKTLDRINARDHTLPLNLRHQGSSFDIDRRLLGSFLDYDVVWTLERLRTQHLLEYSVERISVGDQDREFFHVTAPTTVIAQTKKPGE